MLFYMQRTELFSAAPMILYSADRADSEIREEKINSINAK